MFGARSVLAGLAAMAGMLGAHPIVDKVQNSSRNKPNGRAPGAHKAAWRKAMKARRTK